jgi:NAD(P)-dependent dehydrogenase (short-subunit alcohol dehydrogenase family)
MKSAIVTDATQFVGGPAITALQAVGFSILAHDHGFAADAARAAFQANHPGVRVSHAHAMQTLVEEAMLHAGRLDVCVLNSAYPAERMPLGRYEDARLRAAFQALVFAPLELANAAAPHMIAQKSGKLIFCTSAAPLRGLSNYSLYASARGAANAAVKSLALEMGPHNVQVNAVAPNFLESETYFPKSLMAEPAAAKKILGNIPLGRLGKPEEAAALIAYLASPQSDFVTGQIIALAGGWA